MKKRVFNFNLPDELRDYLKSESDKKFTTTSNYLISLIVKDKDGPPDSSSFIGGGEDKLNFKESMSLESNLIGTILERILAEFLFEELDIPKIKTIISDYIDKLLKIEYSITIKEINNFVTVTVCYKTEEMSEFRVVESTVIPGKVF